MYGIEHIQKAEEYFLDGKQKEAEKEFSAAIAAYKRERDEFGLVFALGTMANFLEEIGRFDDALKVYRQAIFEFRTDIPATYSGYINLLVRQDLIDEAFAVAEKWQSYGARHISESPYVLFITIGNRLIRESQFDKAINVLERAANALKKTESLDDYWRAVGSLGYAYERSGNLDKAVSIYAEAIKSGSRDRQTYTRFLTYLERQGQFEEALRTVDIGLKVQNDAAWETELKKRRIRIEKKSGKTVAGVQQNEIPYFSVRKGTKITQLIQQVMCSPLATNAAFTQTSLFTTSAGKQPKLTAWNLADRRPVWVKSLGITATGLITTSNSIVVFSRQGKIGDGKTELHFFDFLGEHLNIQNLPDVFSQIVATDNHVFAGCRNGKLYAFTEKGAKTWEYELTSDDEVEGFAKPCPYYVGASSEMVAFSSFNNLYALDLDGKLLWSWSTPSSTSSRKLGSIIITTSTGDEPINGLCVTSDNRVLVIAGRVLYEVLSGKTVFAFPPREYALTSLATDRLGKVIAVSSGRDVSIFKDRRKLGDFAIEFGPILGVHSEEKRITAWYNQSLYITRLSGVILSQIEFAKRISGVSCIGDTVVVVAGHVIYLRIQEVSQTSQLPPGQQLAVHASEQTETAYPDKEHGIAVKWITGHKLTNSGKALYEGFEGTTLSIEQFALEHYRKNGFAGYWTENEYWWALMALLFWDEIFARIPGVFSPLFEFPSKQQDMPHDLFTSEFYARRRELIERRVSELSQPRLFGLKKPNIEAELRMQYRKRYRIPCRLIDWDSLDRRFQLEHLLTATRVLNSQQLLAILLHLLENFDEFRRGLPDLFLAKDQKPLFVEVKSEKEKVAEHQYAWMRYLRDIVGVSVEICRVIDE